MVVSRSSLVDSEKAAVAARRLDELASKPGTRVEETGRTTRVHVGTKFASWTCTSCGQKNHSPEGKVMVCESCGNPKGQDETYQEAPSEAPFATDSQLSEAHISADHDADTTCPFCSADVYHDVEICPQCGGNIAEGIPAEKSRSANSASVFSVPKLPLNPKLVAGIVGGVVALCLGIAGLFLFFRPQTDEMYVQSVSWTRTINVEEYQFVAHEGLASPPSDAENVQSEVRLTGYQDVLDHYETQQVEKSREEIDHYETRYRTEYETVSDGYEDVCHTESVYDRTESVYDHTDTITYSDGTTDTEDVYRDVDVYVDQEVCERVERTHQETVQVPYEEPVYKTVYYTEDVQVPIYRQEPVHQTYYWWSRWEWTTVAPVVASGSDNSPYWPDLRLSEVRRESGRNEVFTVVFAWARGDEAEEVFDDYAPVDDVEFARYIPGSVWLIKHGTGGFEILEQVDK
ncbi:MAG: Ran-binding zinc finger domain-containing protein [Patescibacteria group bacterium]